MKWSKSFCKASNLFVLMAVVACQTPTAAQLTSKSGDRNSTHASQARPSQFKIDTRSAKEFYSYYCQSGKPLREYQFLVTAVTPAITGSMPIDLAAKLNGAMADTIREAVRDLFDSQHEMSIFATDLPHQGLIGDFKSFTYNVKKLRVRSKAVISEVMDPNDIGVQPKILLDLPFAFFSSRDGSSLILGTRDAVEGGHVLPTSLGPSREIFERFTMLVPLDDQKKVFPKLFARLNPYLKAQGAQAPEVLKMMQQHQATLERASAVFLNRDGTFNISAAINQRREMWRLYVDHFIFVKEFQTEDPKLIKFQVGLDMTAVCAYARPVEDLIVSQ